jgi:tripartite ATP-independent transporter DctM subunit
MPRESGAPSTLRIFIEKPAVTGSPAFAGDDSGGRQTVFFQRDALSHCKALPMTPDMVAVTGFVALFALMLLRVPVGMAMGLVGVVGYAYINDLGPALKQVSQTSMRTVTDYNFGVIPMFLLMGAFVSASGMSRELFRAANTLVGRRPGGLGIATVVACAGFAAISGSSVATAATFSTVAYPEMRRYKYPQSFATGVIAAGGTLGAIFPPSTVLAVYGLLTQQDVGKLFIAGILPGLLAVSMYVATIFLIGWIKPGFLPAGEPASAAEKIAAVRGIWAPLALFVFVIGGLYGGLFTPTEAGGMGAGGAFLIGVARGRLSGADIRASLLQATRTAAAVFTVLIGAFLFGYFLTNAETPQKVTAFLVGLGVGSYGVLALIMVMYLVLGCLMDAMAMIILTVPIVFPVITALGFDPIWFGVIIVMTVELGLIHPPVGMNVFVIKSVVKDVDFMTIFKGVLPFILTDLVRLVILIAFPVIALWLPGRM